MLARVYEGRTEYAERFRPDVRPPPYDLSLWADSQKLSGWGLSCWNLMFDDLLRTLEETVENLCVDDLVVVVTGNSRREIETEGQHVVNNM